MKTKIIAVIFFLSLGVITRAQNLVYNGYFEINDTCPNSSSLYPSHMQINYALGWHASALTPDYYNSCAGFGNNESVPRNHEGYQKDCCGGGGILENICLIKMIPATVIESMYIQN